MTPTPSKPAKWWNRAHDKPAGEALKAALPDYIELWRIIRKAGRSNAAKAQAVADHLDSIATRTPHPSALDEEAINAIVIEAMSAALGQERFTVEAVARNAIQITLTRLKDRGNG